MVDDDKLLITSLVSQDTDQRSWLTTVTYSFSTQKNPQPSCHLASAWGFTPLEPLGPAYLRFNGPGLRPPVRQTLLQERMADMEAEAQELEHSAKASLAGEKCRGGGWVF